MDNNLQINQNAEQTYVFGKMEIEQKGAKM